MSIRQDAFCIGSRSRSKTPPGPDRAETGETLGLAASLCYTCPIPIFLRISISNDADNLGKLQGLETTRARCFAHIHSNRTGT